MSRTGLLLALSVGTAAGVASARQETTTPNATAVSPVLVTAARPAHTKLSCTVAADGSLNGCRVIFEDPKGEGFGDAALKLAKLYRMKTVSADGRPTAGATVVVPVTWIAPPP